MDKEVTAIQTETVQISSYNEKNFIFQGLKALGLVKLSNNISLISMPRNA